MEKARKRNGIDGVREEGGREEMRGVVKERGG